jgi:hypothetical protein
MIGSNRGKRSKGLVDIIQTELDVVEVKAPSKRKPSRAVDLPPELQEVLEATQSLTDEAFEDWLHARWYRVALLTLAQMASSGNIRALDAYLKRADEWTKEKEEPNKAPQPAGGLPSSQRE